MGKLLTIEDVRNRYQCGRDAAYQTIRDAGGKKIAGRWRVREEKLEEFEMGPSKPKRPTDLVVVDDYASALLAEED